MSFGRTLDGRSRTITPLRGNTSAQIVINLSVGNVAAIKASSPDRARETQVPGWRHLARELQASLSHDSIAFYVQPFVPESKPTDVLSVLNNFTEINKRNIGMLHMQLLAYFKTVSVSDEKALRIADNIVRHFMLRNMRAAGIIKWDRDQKMGSREIMNVHSMQNDVTIAVSAFSQLPLFGKCLVGQNLYLWIPVGEDARMISTNMLQGDMKREGVITLAVCSEDKLDWLGDMKQVRELYLTGKEVYKELFPPGQRGALAPYLTWQKVIDDDIMLSGLALVRVLLDMGFISVIGSGSRLSDRFNGASACLSLTGDDRHVENVRGLLDVATLMFPEIAAKANPTDKISPSDRESMWNLSGALRSAVLLTKDAANHEQRMVYRFGSYWDGTKIARQRDDISGSETAFINALNKKLELSQMAQVKVGFDVRSSLENCRVGKQLTQLNSQGFVDVACNFN
jgi:hypothetical protein